MVGNREKSCRTNTKHKWFWKKDEKGSCVNKAACCWSENAQDNGSKKGTNDWLTIKEGSFIEQDIYWFKASVHIYWHF